MIFKEDQHTELKENPKSATIVNEIVAFLNTCDGKIYIGVKDDGMVVGVSNVDEAMLRIADMLSNEILPSPEALVSIDSIEEDGKSIVSISVRKGNDLFYVKKYGRSSSGCLKRVGTSSRGMSEKEIEYAREVLEAIEEGRRQGKGAVSIGGIIWTARSDSDEVIPAGSLVRVLRIEGVKVFVELIKEETSCRTT